MIDDRIEGLLAAADKQQLATMLVESRIAEERYKEALGEVASILCATSAQTRHTQKAMDVIRGALGDE